jgi:hypothetical protein
MVEDPYIEKTRVYALPPRVAMQPIMAEIEN